MEERVQDRAIKHTGSHALLLAGPGTGKTKTITEHIVFLIKEKNVNPNKILALTFTKAAANEMLERLKILGLTESELPDVRTLHSYCFKQLRKATRYEFVGTAVLDKWEERNLFINDLSYLLNEPQIRIVNELVEGNDADWEMLTPPPSPATQSQVEIRMREIRRIYGYARRGELVYQFKKYLDSDPTFNPNIEHILVDEYQDLNTCDLYVIKVLSERSNALVFAAGDDDQCIYRFRHADPRGIRSFSTKYPNSTIYSLDECYRCSKSILISALKLMLREPNRLEKRLTPTHSSEGQLKIIAAPSEDEQLFNVADIVMRHTNENVKAEDILLLVPRKALAQQYVEAIKGRGIEAINLTESPDIFTDNDQRKIQYAIRFRKEEYKDYATRGWLECTNGIGKATIQKLLNESLTTGVKFYEVAKRSSNKNVNAAINELEETSTKTENEEIRKNMYTQKGMSEAATEYLETMFAENDPFMAPDVRTDEEEDDIEEDKKKIKGVRVMTMRGSKGLSATVTLITDVEEHLIPADAMDVNEERRLLYVSMTRAKQFLYISHCLNRSSVTRYLGTGASSMGGRRARSMFLEELGTPSGQYDPDLLNFNAEENW